MSFSDILRNDYLDHFDTFGENFDSDTFKNDTFESVWVDRHPSSHLADLGIVTQRDCATTTLHFLLLVVHMEWKILIEHIPNPASDKFKAYFFPNFGHICTKI